MTQPEFELHETGVFDEQRYFDVFVEYAKRDAEDMLIEIVAINRGPDAADLHVLPTSGSATPGHGVRTSRGRRSLRAIRGGEGPSCGSTSRSMARAGCIASGAAELLFTENETNTAAALRHRSGPPTSRTPSTALSSTARPAPSIRQSTAPRRRRTLSRRIPAGGEYRVRLRLTDRAPDTLAAGAFAGFDRIVAGAARGEPTRSTPR